MRLKWLTVLPLLFLGLAAGTVCRAAPTGTPEGGDSGVSADPREALAADAERALAEYRRVLADLKSERERLRNTHPAPGVDGYGVVGSVALVLLGSGLGGLVCLLRNRRGGRGLTSPVHVYAVDASPAPDPASGSVTAPAPDPDLVRRLGAVGTNLAALPTVLREIGRAPGEAGVASGAVGESADPGVLPGQLEADVERLEAIARAFPVAEPGATVVEGSTESPPQDGAAEVEQQVAAALDAIPVLYGALVRLSEAAVAAMRDAAGRCRDAEVARAMAEEALACAQPPVEPVLQVSAAPDPQEDPLLSRVVDDLRFTGYLDWEAGLRQPVLDHAALAELLAQAGADTRARPELQAYVRALAGLREVLGEPPVQAIPWFRSAGLDQLHEHLYQKRSFQALYRSAAPREALLGQWGAFLQLLFRACLLLETYWPDADPGLTGRLRRCRNCARLVLGRYGIEPHPLVLPVARTWLSGRSWVEEGPSAGTAPELAKDPAVLARVETLGAAQSVFYDVAWWGYTLADDRPGEAGSASLLVRW